MNGIILHSAGNTPALRHACQNLSDRGIHIVHKPAPDVTHLLLPVPSFESDGRIKGGGILEHILADLPDKVTIIGGNLNHCPIVQKYSVIDLLQDPAYVAENAAITADCAIRIAGNALPVIMKDCPILVIGWGRIGKCLAAQLKAMGANVDVAARKGSDRAMLQALGYGAKDPGTMNRCLVRYRVIFNTVPAPILSESQVKFCRQDCIKIDLATEKGIPGKDVIWARGLPNKDAPESSGALIAKSVIRLMAGKEQTT